MMSLKAFRKYDISEHIIYQNKTFYLEEHLVINL